MDRRWWTLLAVCAGTFMLLLDVTIVVVALPDIQVALDASLAGAQWVIDAYALALASLLLATGVLADRYGRRRLFAIGLIVFTAGSLTCGLSASTAMLIASRATQGAGGAVMFATSLALLADSFTGASRGAAFGIWGAVTGASVSLGPIVGGAITSGISWRGIFLINIPIGALAILVTLTRVRESRSHERVRQDWIGFALLTGGLVAVVYGLIRASENTWGDAGVIAALAVGGVLLVGFVVAEAVVEAPLFDLSLFGIPTFTGGLIAALTMNGSLFAMFLYLVLYLQDVLGYSAIDTGLRLLVSTGALFVTAAISGRLSERLSVRGFISVGLVLVGIGLLLMTGLDGDSSWTHLLPGLIVAGLGAGLVNPPLAATAIGVVPAGRAGMASGANSTFRQIGFAAAIAALGPLFTAAIQRHAQAAIANLPGADRIVGDIRPGTVGDAIDAAPASARGHLIDVARNSFAAGINQLLIVTGVIALVGAAATLILIRDRDFHPSQARSG